MKFKDYLIEGKDLLTVKNDLMSTFRLGPSMISLKNNVNTGVKQIEIFGHGAVKPIENYVKKKYPELEFYGKKRGKMFTIIINARYPK